ncbi:MAG: hypothetical protein KC621_27165 [Myxococcales bacterium]|nr:hypothetical protein [Myxococcales bacterium]
MIWLPATLLGCPSLKALPKDSPCVEAGYAIAHRTFECTGDGDLANARFEKFRDRYQCIELPDWFVDTGVVTKYIQATDTGVFLNPPDYYHCALAIDQLACELVFEYGDDIARYLNSSDACAYVIEPKAGR